jgi:hypothetical protein
MEGWKGGRRPKANEKQTGDRSNLEGFFEVRKPTESRTSTTRTRTIRGVLLRTANGEPRTSNGRERDTRERDRSNKAFQIPKLKPQIPPISQILEGSYRGRKSERWTGQISNVLETKISRRHQPEAYKNITLRSART